MTGCRTWPASCTVASRGLLSPRTRDGSPRLRQAVGVFLTGCGSLLNGNNRFINGSTRGLLGNHWHTRCIGCVTISESSVFSSSLEKPEESQYSISQSSLEPLTSTLSTYLKEKKITQKHKHITGDRAPTSNSNTLPLSPTLLSFWGPVKALHDLAARVAA